jgi:hypothetical protein
MPVDQTGEAVIFVLDGQHVEAHIRIDYEYTSLRRIGDMLHAAGR